MSLTIINVCWLFESNCLKKKQCEFSVELSKPHLFALYCLAHTHTQKKKNRVSEKRREINLISVSISNAFSCA